MSATTVGLLAEDATIAPGRYSIVGTEIGRLPTGQVVTADRRSMARSALNLARAIQKFMRFTESLLDHANRAVTANPAALVGRPEICGAIDAGARVNLVCFGLGPHEPRIEHLLLAGERVLA